MKLKHPGYMKRIRQLISQEKVNNYDSWFEEISRELFFNLRLKIKNNIYEIIEIEFYINEAGHPDVFSHSTSQQKQNGSFCFHQTGKSYREGNYKGVDIAIGNEKRFGGILIRSLKEISGQRIIEGPSNVVTEILSLYGYKKVRELVPHVDLDMEGNDFCLIDFEEKKHKPFRSPRVGLTLKKDCSKKIHFLVKDYRFIKYPDLIKKGKHWIIASELLKSQKGPSLNNVQLKYYEWLTKGKQHYHFDKINLGPESTIRDFIEFYGFSHKDLEQNS